MRKNWEEALRLPEMSLWLESSAKSQNRPTMRWLKKILLKSQCGGQTKIRRKTKKMPSSIDTERRKKKLSLSPISYLIQRLSRLLDHPSDLEREELIYLHQQPSQIAM